MSATEFSFAVTTAVTPPKKFTVDGAEYELYSPDHLTPDQEAEVSALFARHGLLVQELEVTRNTEKGKGVALQVQGTRRRLIASLTSMTVPEIEKLPLGAQGRIMAAVQDEMVAAIMDEESDADKGKTDGVED